MPPAFAILAALGGIRRLRGTGNPSRILDRILDAMCSGRRRDRCEDGERRAILPPRDNSYRPAAGFRWIRSAAHRHAGSGLPMPHRRTFATAFVAFAHSDAACVRHPGCAWRHTPAPGHGQPLPEPSFGADAGPAAAGQDGRGSVKWRRGESNPCPVMFQHRRLRVCPVNLSLARASPADRVRRGPARNFFSPARTRR